MKDTKTLIVEGVEFPSRTAAARHYGLNPKLVNERVTKFGWTLEQALELEARPKGDYRKKVVIDGTEYSSMRQAARALGVAQSTLMNRIKAGISVEEALSASFYSGLSSFWVFENILSFSFFPQFSFLVISENLSR